MAGGNIGAVTITVEADASGIPGDVEKATRSLSGVGDRLGRLINAGLSKGLSGSLSAVTSAAGNQITAGLGRAGEAAGAALARGLGPRAAQGVATFLNQLRSADAATAAFGALGERVGGRVATALGPKITNGIANLTAGFKSAQAAGSSFTGPLGSIGGIIRGSMNIGVSAVRNMASVTRSAFSGLVGAASSAWSKISGGASKAFAAVGRTATQSLKAAGSLAGAGMAATLGTALTKGFSRLESIDTATAKLTGLGHSTDAVARIMDSAKAAVQGTAYGLGDAASAAAQFAAAGVPLDGMQRSLSILASASSVAGADMSEMTTIFGKVAATGKLNGEVVQQLAERGIPVLSLLAKQYGISGEAAQKMVSDGKVDFASFQSVLEGSLGPAAAAMGGSFSGMLKNVGAALGRFGAAAQAPAFEALKSLFPPLISAIDQMTSVVGPLASALGERLAPYVERLAGALAGLDLSGLASSLSAGGGAVDGFLNALGPLLPLLGLAAGALGPLLQGLPVIGGLFSAVTGPVGLFAGALAALLLVDPSTLTAGFQSLAGMLPGLISGVVSMITTMVPQLVATLAANIPVFVMGFLSLVQAVIPALVAAIPQIISAFLTLIPQLITTLLGAVPAILQAALTLFLGIVQGIITVIPQIIAALITVLPQIMTALISMLPQIVSSALELFMGIVQAVVEAIPVIITAVLDLLPVLLETVLGMLPALIGAALELFLGIVLGVVQALPSIINAIVGMLPQFISTIIGMLPQLIQAAVQLFIGIVTGIAQAIPQIIQAVLGLLPVIINALMTMIPQLIGAGVDLIAGLVQGLWNAAGQVGAALLKIAQDAVGSFLSFLGINSPSRLFMQFGRYIGDGLVVGLKGTTSKVTSAVKGLVGKVNTLYDGIQSDRAKALKKISDLEDRLVGTKAGKARTKILKDLADQRRIVAQADKILGRASRGEVMGIISAANKRLSAIAKEREGIAKRLGAARDLLADRIEVRADFAAGLRSGVKDLAAIGNSKTVEGYVFQLKKQRDAAAKFNATIASLTKMGLSKNAIAELAENFASTGSTSMADSILAGGQGAVDQVNGLRKQLDDQAKKLGNSVGDTLYKAGIDSARGLVRGLESESASLARAADKIAKELVRRIKKELGIKSPSRVLASVGKNTILGFIGGVKSLAKSAAQVMSDTLNPGKMDVNVSSMPTIGPRGPSTPPPPAAGAGAGGVHFHEGSVVAKGVESTDVPRLANETADRVAEKVSLAA